MSQVVSQSGNSVVTLSSGLGGGGLPENFNPTVPQDLRGQLRKMKATAKRMRGFRKEDAEQLDKDKAELDALNANGSGDGERGRALRQKAIPYMTGLVREYDRNLADLEAEIEQLAVQADAADEVAGINESAFSLAAAANDAGMTREDMAAFMRDWKQQRGGADAEQAPARP